MVIHPNLKFVSVVFSGGLSWDAIPNGSAEVPARLLLLSVVGAVLMRHMGGKVAQVVAARRPGALVGLVLVAPAPPTPMLVAEAQRAAMLDSYSSREGVEQALSILAGGPLSVALPEQVIEDTLRGLLAAKRGPPFEKHSCAFFRSQLFVSSKALDTSHHRKCGVSWLTHVPISLKGI